MEKFKIIKNISKRIEISSFFFFFALISCFSAFIKNFLFFTSIILIHELGHFLTGIILGWKPDKIYIYPFGGVTKFDDDLNKPIREELLILVAGPTVQILFYLIIRNFLSLHDLRIFYNYHLSILLFNLLPIYPLDGGKLMKLLFETFISVRKSFSLVIFISLIFDVSIIIFLLKKFPLNIILMFIFLLSKIIREYRNRDYYFNKFILERYINSYHFSRVKVISSIKKMMRGYRHIIKIDNNYWTEKQYLYRLYKRK